MQAQSTEEDDRCLLKIVNHHDSTFYLESAALTKSQSLEMDVVPQGRSNLNENMYLVVRSIKYNNEKIVSRLQLTKFKDYEIQEKDILKIGRVKFAVKEIGYATDSQKMEVD